MKKTLCLLFSLLLTASAVLCGCGETDSSSSETAAVRPTDTTVKTTGEKIHINDSTLGEIWITELEGVRVNELDNNGFTADENLKYYSENGKPASTEGVDVSEYSGEIDWEKVKESGIDFAMIRVGGRGYGEEGKMYSDTKAIEYINGAKNAGIKVGAYFFSQAVTTEEAVEEADFVKSILGDIKLDYPVAYDWEIIKNDDARTDSVSASQTTECARAFCDRIKEHGYTPIIY